MVNRYYDPQTGQFLTVDPLVDQSQQPYGYAAGDPIDHLDPAGDWSCTKLQTIVLPILCGLKTAWQSRSFSTTGIDRFQQFGTYDGMVAGGTQEQRLMHGGVTVAQKWIWRMRAVPGATGGLQPDGSIVVAQPNGATAIYQPASLGSLGTPGYSGPPTIYSKSSGGKLVKTRFLP